MESGKGRITTVIFAVIAGFFGADDYYLGNTARGVVRSVLGVAAVVGMATLTRTSPGAHVWVANILLYVNVAVTIAFALRALAGRQTDGEGRPVTRW